MRRGENPSEVLKGVKRPWKTSTPTRLPPGVRIRGIYDRTDLVANTMHTVSHTLLEGLIVLIAMLLFFLGSVRAALLTAITIPLSLLFAFVCMHFTGIPANLLSLGALDFGIIVDGTLVMVEHIVTICRSGSAPRRSRQRIRNHCERRPGGGVAHILSLLIIISAYIPLFTLERVERRLFTPMAYTVAMRCWAPCCFRSP